MKPDRLAKDGSIPATTLKIPVPAGAKTPPPAPAPKQGAVPKGK